MKLIYLNQHNKSVLVIISTGINIPFFRVSVTIELLFLTYSSLPRTV